jgi:chemotaxis protein CheX
MSARVVTEAPPVPDHMVNDLVLSTQEVFGTMLFQDAVARPSRPAVSREPRADVVATIHLTGPSRAVIGLYCTELVAKSMAGSMLGIEAAEIGDEFADALGELANMIAGSFRNRMAALGGAWAISVPTVTIGTGIITHYPTDVGRVICPFDIRGGELLLELVLRR